MLHMIMCLEDVNSFIQNIESMAEKINFSLFEEFFGSPSPVDYAKELINTKNPDENKKKCSRDKRQNIRFKRQNKKISETEK